MSKTGAVIKIVAIFVAAIIGMVVWSAVVDKAYGYDCYTEYECRHPSAAKTQTNEYKAGELRRTRPAAWDRVIPREMKVKMKRAYRRYTEKHPYGPPTGGRVVARTSTTSMTAQSAYFDWPSPREWFRSFATSVGCAFVGTTPGATSTYCSSGKNDMLKKTSRMSNEVGRVTIKCGGDMVLGGLANESAKDVAKKMGWRLNGGIGFYAAAAHCAWNNYFDRWWWN